MKPQFYSVLLLALPEFCAGGEFRTMPHLESRYPDGSTANFVDIVCLNCKTKQEILPLLQKLKQQFEQQCALQPKSEVLAKNKAFVIRMIAEIQSGVFEHDVPEKVLESVRDSSQMPLRTNQMIYLSGVTRLES